MRLRLVLWAQHGLTVVGVLALGYCAAGYVETCLFQTKASRSFGSRLQNSQTAVFAPPGPATARRPPGDGAVVGRLEIPRLKLDVMIVEGTAYGDLRRAAGHIPGTALPGEQGNVAIAAHRDTFFRPLREIRPRDTITLDTLHGDYSYRVVSTRIVSPEDVQVLNPTARDSLTLVTCFPFDYIGPAPKRFIVRAERIART